jgi:cell division protein ZapA
LTEERPAVRVVIFGNEYTIRGEANADYIRELAHYVDGKMQEIARNANLAIPLKVSILAAINLADEVFRLRAARNDKPDLPAPAEASTAEAGDGEASPPPELASQAILALAKHIEEALNQEPGML